MAIAGKDQTQEMAELSRFEKRLDQLNTTFEQYFLGIERRPPTDEWELLKKEMRQLMTRPSNNTAYKFRRNSLNMRLTSRNTYWERTLKQIEEGTYHRHKFMAEIRERQRREQAEQLGGARKAAASEEKTAPKPGGDYVDKLHAAFVAARQKTGESTNIPREQLAQIVQKQVAAIKQRYNCKSVEFKVAIENGKTKLKAVPKN